MLARTPPRPMPIRRAVATLGDRLQWYFANQHCNDRLRRITRLIREQVRFAFLGKSRLVLRDVEAFVKDVLRQLLSIHTTGPIVHATVEQKQQPEQESPKTPVIRWEDDVPEADMFIVQDTPSLSLCKKTDPEQIVTLNWAEIHHDDWASWTRTLDPNDTLPIAEAEVRFQMAALWLHLWPECYAEKTDGSLNKRIIGGRLGTVVVESWLASSLERYIGRFFLLLDDCSRPMCKCCVQTQILERIALPTVERESRAICLLILAYL